MPATAAAARWARWAPVAAWRGGERGACGGRLEEGRIGGVRRAAWAGDTGKGRGARGEARLARKRGGDLEAIINNRFRKVTIQYARCTSTVHVRPYLHLVVISCPLPSQYRTNSDPTRCSASRKDRAAAVGGEAVQSCSRPSRKVRDEFRGKNRKGAAGSCMAAAACRCMSSHVDAHHVSRSVCADFVR